MADDLSGIGRVLGPTRERWVNAGLALLVGWTGSCAAAMPVLHIDATDVTAHVSALHAGLMTEEINHSYDGGLYAELISNRAFTDQWGLPYWMPLHWSVVSAGSSAAVAALDDSVPLSKSLGTGLHLTAIAASSGNRAGLSNDGFWGIPVKPATLYRASFYARVEAGANAIDELSVSIESASGPGTVYAKADVPLVPGAWRRYQVELKTAADVVPTANARFILSTQHPGSVWLNLVSLFPPTWNDRPNGNRIDLMQKLAALHPAFLRFPGGNYLEGDTIASRFDWKKTLGPLTERPSHAAPWNYQSTDGLGLLEFLQWSEDLHVEPVLGVYAGLSFKEPAVHAGEDLKPYVQDALDEIEYITGGATTTWGARRVKDGHPAPFKLTYVEIGNEDWNDAVGYEARFAQFHDAIKAAYPALQLIATIPVTSRTPDVLDEHYYRSAQAFVEDVHHYDLHSRKGPKIFVGEWATTEGTPTPNMNAALGDAAWMTGMERNADLIIMQAYAPLFANLNPNAYQWNTNLIGYDALTSYGSPSYYAQAMFNAHRGDVVVRSSPGVATGLFHSVTRDTKTGTIYLKVVNVLTVPQTVSIELDGAGDLQPTGEQWILSGNPADTNTLQDPTHVVPMYSKVSDVSTHFSHVFPANSISVLELSTRPPAVNRF